MEGLCVEIINPGDNLLSTGIYYFVYGSISMVISKGFENKKITSYLHCISSILQGFFLLPVGVKNKNLFTRNTEFFLWFIYSIVCLFALKHSAFL